MSKAKNRTMDSKKNYVKTPFISSSYKGGDTLTDLSNVFVREPPDDETGLWDEMPRQEYVVYSRADWDARPPLEGIPGIKLPAVKVVYTAEWYDYAPVCRNHEECVRSMRYLQDLYMDEKHLPDIPYNFVVGGDGNIYEGRGWNIKPQKAVKFQEYSDNTIDIGMITHFVNEPLNKRSKIELDLFNVLTQFVFDHLDDKLIANEYTIEGYTGKRKY